MERKGNRADVPILLTERSEETFGETSPRYRFPHAVESAGSGSGQPGAMSYCRLSLCSGFNYRACAVSDRRGDNLGRTCRDGRPENYGDAYFYSLFLAQHV